MITSGGGAAVARPNAAAAPMSVAGVALIACIVLFWRLGAPTFWDPDEAHYAETTRELIATGGWMAPLYNGAPFFDKPILFHWLQAVPMAMLGPTELAARLIPAAAALALVGITGWVAASLVSTDVALMAALLLATSPATFALARYAILDTLFTAFLFGGASLVAVAALGERPRLQWYGYLAIALAVLTKGPLALVLCGLALGLAAVLSRQVRARFSRLRLVSGLAVVLAVAAPWFVYMVVRFGRPFVDGYLLNENIRLYAIDRFTPTESSSPWFYLRVIGAALLPWTALIVGRLVDEGRAWLRGEGSIDTVDVLLWSWTIAVVAFFTFSRFKLDHYVFPAAPSLCVIGARAWISLGERSGRSRLQGTRAGQLMVGPSLVVAAGALAWLLIARLELPGAALIVPVVLGAAGVAVGLRVRMQSRQPGIPWVVFAALLVTYVGALVWVLPALETRKVIPDVARWVASRATAADRVATYRLNRWNTAFRFYVGRDVAMIDAPEAARALFGGAEPFYCTMLSDAYDDFVAHGAPLRVAYERDGMWATSGRVLWRRPAPLTRFVVVTRRQ